MRPIGVSVEVPLSDDEYETESFSGQSSEFLLSTSNFHYSVDSKVPLVSLLYSTRSISFSLYELMLKNLSGGSSGAEESPTSRPRLSHKSNGSNPALSEADQLKQSQEFEALQTFVQRCELREALRSKYRKYTEDVGANALADDNGAGAGGVGSPAGQKALGNGVASNEVDELD